MGKGDHSKTFLLLELRTLLLEHSFLLKSCWVEEEVILPVEEVILFCGGGYTPCGGGYSHSCDYCVSPVQRIGFLGFLDLV